MARISLYIAFLKMFNSSFKNRAGSKLLAMAAFFAKCVYV